MGGRQFLLVKEITHATNEFVITIPRESNQDDGKVTKFKQEVTKS
ncbi:MULTISPECIES: hypothetical protein [Bacteroidaceae]|nr:MULTISPECIES: hypothetical protein [Bacteroidaceae]